MVVSAGLGDGGGVPVAGAAEVDAGAEESRDPDAIRAQARNENFPVAPWFLPRRVRGHLMALYGFARLVDDTGDEAAGDRLLLLEQIERDLDRLYAGSVPRQPVLLPLVGTIAACQLPRAPFDALVEANRRDQRQTRYVTWEDLLDYCRLSANPVGQLVLHVARVATPDRIALADQVCSALQVLEHLQDVREDFARDRVYLPQADLESYGVREDDLGQASTSPAVRRLLAHEGARARAMLDRGAPLVGTLRGWPRLATAGFVGGGRAALIALAVTGHGLTMTVPRPSRGRVVAQSLSVYARGR